MFAIIYINLIYLYLCRHYAQTIQDQLVPLMSEAAFKGDVPSMQKLVAKGASVNQHDQVPQRFTRIQKHSMHTHCLSVFI